LIGDYPKTAVEFEKMSATDTISVTCDGAAKSVAHSAGEGIYSHKSMIISSIRAIRGPSASFSGLQHFRRYRGFTTRQNLFTPSKEAQTAGAVWALELGVRRGLTVGY
jgi:hypothetical protein